MLNGNYIKKINGLWYAFGANEEQNQVYSIGNDNPDGGRWMAKWTDDGIKYVASPVKTKSAAINRCKKNGRYDGELN